MTICCLHDKKTIERVLRKNVYLNIYGIGDLDDFFWPYTVWYAGKNDLEINEIALLYFRMPLPTFLAISDRVDDMTHMTKSVAHLLPAKFYAHLSPGVESALERDFIIDSHGEYLKMGLFHRSAVNAYDCQDTIILDHDDTNKVKRDIKEFRKDYQTLCYCFKEDFRGYDYFEIA